MKGVPVITDSPLEAALEYAAQGLCVVPIHSVEDGECSCSKGVDCPSPGKHPRTPHGLKDATTDPEQIREWFAKWPDSNVGIRTGLVSGIFVVDTDNYKDAFDRAAFIETIGGLPDVIPYAETGGGGVHYIFEHPGEGFCVPPSTSKIGPGIDVKGDDGCVVVWPSTHASGNQYVWATQISAAIRPAKASAKLLKLVAIRAATDAELKLFHEATKGKLNDNEINECVAKHASLTAALEAAKQLVIDKAASNTFSVGEDGYAAVRCLTAMNSLHATMNGQSYRDQGDGSKRLFMQAIRTVEHGLPPMQALEVLKSYSHFFPFPQDWSDKQILRRIRDAEKHKGVKRGSCALSMGRRELDFAFAHEIEPEEWDWLWPGMIAVGSFFVCAGMQGHGKSFLMLDAARRISLGLPFPHPDCEKREPGHAVYMNLEDSPSKTTVQRLLSLGADMKRITVVKGVKEPDGSFSFWNVEDSLNLLADHLARKDVVNPKLVICDPITSFLPRGCQPNDNIDIVHALSPLGHFAEEHDIAFSGVMHFKQAATTDAMMRVIGSIGMTTVCRTAIAVVRDPDKKCGRRYAIPLKNNLTADDHGGRIFEIVDGKVNFLEGEPPDVDIACDPAEFRAFCKQKREAPGALAKAKKFFLQAVALEERTFKQIVDEGKKLENGHAERTLRDARTALRKEGLITGRKVVVDDATTTMWRLAEIDPDAAARGAKAEKEDKRAANKQPTSKVEPDGIVREGDEF